MFVFSTGLISNIICLVTLCRPSLKKGQGSVNIILVSMAAIGEHKPQLNLFSWVTVWHRCWGLYDWATRRWANYLQRHLTIKPSISPSPSFYWPPSSCQIFCASHFRTNWLSWLGLRNQVGSTTDQLKLFPTQHIKRFNFVEGIACTQSTIRKKLLLSDFFYPIKCCPKDLRWSQVLIPRSR